jgi:hypothetical protein
LIGVRAVDFGHAIRSMEADGRDLREAVRHWSARKTLHGKFSVDIRCARGDERWPAPAMLSVQLERASCRLSRLEVTQARHGRRRGRQFEDGEIDLATGLKLARAPTQPSCMWRGWPERGLPTFADRHDQPTQGRKADRNFARRQRTSESERAKAVDHLLRAARLRVAIASADARSMGLDDEIAPLPPRGHPEVGQASGPPAIGETAQAWRVDWNNGDKQRIPACKWSVPCARSVVAASVVDGPARELVLLA